jgi:undecaprenyl-diphosphatase
MLAAAVVMVLFMMLASEMREGETQPFDDAVRSLVYGVASNRATSVLRIATELGAPLFLIPLALMLSLVFVYRRRIPDATLLTVAMIGVALLNWTLKAFFQRPRPLPFFGLSTPASYSFPSGHALFAFSFYGILATLVTARLRSPLIRALVWAAAVVLVGVVGFSRVYLGVHYPSDVIAGYATGFVWVLTVASADRILRGPREDGPSVSAVSPNGARRDGD